MIPPEFVKLAARLRIVARHLARRDCGPSLEGYELEDGLLAAADLIEGGEGPVLHDDLTPVVRNADLHKLPRVSLRALMKKLEMRDERIMRIDWAFAREQAGTFRTATTKKLVREAVERWVARARVWNAQRRRWG